MKDTIAKVRALVSMKTCLIEALRQDLASMCAKYDVVTNANNALIRQNKRLVKLSNTQSDSMQYLEEDLKESQHLLDAAEQRIQARDREIKTYIKVNHELKEQNDALEPYAWYKELDEDVAEIELFLEEMETPSPGEEECVNKDGSAITGDITIDAAVFDDDIPF